MNYLILIAPILLLFYPNHSSAVGSTQKKEEHRNHSAHTHGTAKLTIAFDGSTNIDVALESPGDSIVGFEHEAKSPKDKATAKKIFTRLQDNAGKWIISSELSSCKAENALAKFEREPGEEHSEVHFSYRIICPSKIKASKATVALFADFKKLKTLKAIVIDSKGQKEFDLASEIDSFEITP